MSCWRLSPLVVSADVSWNPQHSTRVVEAFWRRRDTVPTAGPGDRNRPSPFRVTRKSYAARGRRIPAQSRDCGLRRESASAQSLLQDLPPERFSVGGVCGSTFEGSAACPHSAERFTKPPAVTGVLTGGRLRWDQCGPPIASESRCRSRSCVAVTPVSTDTGPQERRARGQRAIG